MGFLAGGEWHDEWYDTKSTGGRFERKQSSFRNWVTPDGAPGPSGRGGFAAEPGRYHLYVSLACPWASRALIFRSLKGLDDLIGLSVVDPHMGREGWVFGDFPGATEDPVNHAQRLYEIYLKADPAYEGRVTVPVLWDKKNGTIVSNESAEIIRMFNSAFDGLTGNAADFYPPDNRDEIDAINGRVYDRVNNGVYKAGFATEQKVYEEAVSDLFAELGRLEKHLADGHDFLVGNAPTEADWRLFTTLIRFDAVYHGHFKCNIRRLTDYPLLQAYTERLYRVPGVAKTVDFAHIKTHYYWSHTTINPTRIVPVGPELAFTRPMNDGAIEAAAR